MKKLALLLLVFISSVSFAHVSTKNSTTTPLGAGESFVGNYDDISNIATIEIIGTTDQICTLYFDFSTDGVNIDRSVQLSSGLDTVIGIHGLVSVANFGRVRLVNGATPQTYLRLQAIYLTSAKVAIPTSRLGQNIGIYTDVLNGRTLNDFDLDVSRGNISGYSHPIVAASNVDLGTVVETIWKSSGVWSPMTIARTMSLVSTSVNDTDGGTGANSVLVTGVDENGAAQTELVVMNGTTPVETTGLWLGINPSLVFSAGSAMVNQGNITFTSTIDFQVQTIIEAGDGLTSALIYHVPAGSSFYLNHIETAVYKSSGGGADVVVDGYAITNGVRYNIYEVDLTEDVLPASTLRLDAYSKIAAGSCIYFEGISNKTGTTVRAAFEGVLVVD